MPWAASTSSLPIVRRPSYSAASRSSTGSIILQGGHQSAKKSTTVWLLEPTTSSSNVLSANRWRLLIAVANAFRQGPIPGPRRRSALDRNRARRRVRPPALHPAAGPRPPLVPAPPQIAVRHPQPLIHPLP